MNDKKFATKLRDKLFKTYSVMTLVFIAIFGGITVLVLFVNSLNMNL